MDTEKKRTAARSLVHSLPRVGAALVMTVALAAGMGGAEVVALTALALGAGLLGRDLVANRTTAPSRRRASAVRMPQTR